MRSRGKLVSYDGTMQVDLEIVLLNPPGVSEPSESGASSSASRASTRASERDRASRGSRSSKSSSKSSPRPDLYAELEALKEEMGVDDEAKSENSDDVPEGLPLPLPSLFSLLRLPIYSFTDSLGSCERTGHVKQTRAHHLRLICGCISRFVDLSIYPFICLCSYRFIWLLLYLSMFPSFNLSVFLPFYA